MSTSIDDQWGEEITVPVRLIKMVATLSRYLREEEK